MPAAIDLSRPAGWDHWVRSRGYGLGCVTSSTRIVCARIVSASDAGGRVSSTRIHEARGPVVTRARYARRNAGKVSACSPSRLAAWPWRLRGVKKMVWTHRRRFMPLVLIVCGGCALSPPDSDTDPDPGRTTTDAVVVTVEGQGAVRQTLNDTSVTLTAAASDGWRFAGWFGSITSTENPVTFSAEEHPRITVRFEPVDLPGARDADGDGVDDEADFCPGTLVGDSTDAAGCSPAQRDEDQDGIFDAADECPETMSGEPANEQGCAPGQLDADGDGTTDDRDACPDTPVGVVVDAAGCATSQLDSDGDGVSDDIDLCPNTGANEAPDNTGCAPSQRDGDNDGVVDSLDQCPGTEPGTPVDGTGCAVVTIVCGNGIVETGETCDPPCNRCNEQCQLSGTTGQPKWEVAFDTSSTGALSGVWGSGPSDVFVVGGTGTQGEVYHFDGSVWAPMAVPEVPLLVWVFGFAPDDVYAVGLGGGALHYDGLTWEALDAETTTNLWGVWGNAPNDLWIVGGDAFDGAPLILHYDGETFTSVDPPSIDRPGAHALFKVWGIGSKTFAVGQAGLILEYAAGAWSQQESGTEEDLISLWGTGEDNIVAVGGRFFANIVHYNGAAWSIEQPFAVGALNAVFMSEPDQALVAGANGAALTFDPATNGVSLELTGTFHTIHAIWSDCTGRHYAVGGLFNPPFTGVALVRTIEE